MDSALYKVFAYGKWGLVNREGNQVVPIKYNYIYCSKQHSFDNEIAVVVADKHYGAIDRAGNEIIPLAYDKFEKSGNLVLMKKGKNWFIINGETRHTIELEKQYDILSTTEKMICFMQNDKFGFLDCSGKEIFPPISESSIEFEDGLARICMEDKYGYIDTTGKIVIPTLYDEAGEFNDGLAYTEKGDKKGFIDKENNFRFPFNRADFGLEDSLPFFLVDLFVFVTEMIGALWTNPVRL